MFPRRPSDLPTYGATTRGAVPAEIDEYYRQHGLSDQMISQGAQHPDVIAEQERLRASRIDLYEKEQAILSSGWLDNVNEVEKTLTDSVDAEKWAETATFHEPSAAERAAGEIVIDRQITESLVAVRRSDHTKSKLAGMTRDMFDLGA